MREPSYIVLQCYGNEGVFYECAYALLSLARLYTTAELRQVQVCLYTDKPEWFARFKDCPLSLQYRPVTMAEIKQWRGGIDFVHRVKIEVLKDFTATHSGNILYLDTDVVLTHNLDKMWTDINTGGLYMHVMEGRISDEDNPVFKKLNKFLHNNTPLSTGPKPLYDMAMWNAGVLGFNTRHKHLLDEALRFTDLVYPQFPAHIVEQFAFSVTFGNAGTVMAACPWVFHYWNLKEARQVLAAFFNHFSCHSWPHLVRYASLLQMHVLMQEKLNFYTNRSLAGKIMKRRWVPVGYKWEEMR